MREEVLPALRATDPATKSEQPPGSRYSKGASPYFLEFTKRVKLELRRHNGKATKCGLSFVECET
jgi:hypothetical protein